MSTWKVMRVLAVAMQKGGVGKTTTTVQLACEFARMGLAALVVDLDQQANATKGLGVDPEGAEGTMYEVLTPDAGERASLASVIVKTRHGVDVAPSHLAMRKLDKSLGPLGDRRLAKEVSKLDGYDIVLIDCPPSLGELTVAALLAADGVLAPVGPGPDELDALYILEQSVNEVRELTDSKLAIEHVLLCGYDSRTILSKDIKNTLREDWKEAYLGEISNSVRVPEAKARQIPLYEYAPNNPAVDDYQRVAVAIKERIEPR